MSSRTAWLHGIAWTVALAAAARLLYGAPGGALEQTMEVASGSAQPVLEAASRAASAPRPPGFDRGDQPPFDRPDLAREHALTKRLAGAGPIDAPAAYAAAAAHLAAMPRYSTRLGRAPERPRAYSRSGRGLASWTPLGPGNIGGRTRVLVIRPDRPRVMYAAGVSGGVWKTTNSGRSWRAVGDELTNLAVNSLAMDPAAPRVLYAGTGEGYFREVVRGTGLPLRGGGIFKTDDGGASWSRLPGTGKPAFRWVNDLAVSPLDPARLYAATRKGVYRSLDGGASWRRVLDPRVRGGCLDLALRTDRPTDVLFASCGTFVQATVYRSEAAERGGGWRAVLSDPGMGRTSLALAPSDQETIYALAASNLPGPDGLYEQALHAVFRSDAGGAPGSWQARVRNDDPRELNTLLLTNPVGRFLVDCGFDSAEFNLAMGWYVNVIAVDPQEPDRVWAAGVDLFRSDDGGRNWNLASYWWDEGSDSYVHADHHGLVFHPRKSATLFSLNDGGVHRTHNARAPLDAAADAPCRPGSAGVVWRSLNRGYGVTQFYHGSVFPDGRSYMGGTQDNGTVLGADTAGANAWGRIFGGDGGYSAVDPGNPRVLYVTFQGGEVRKSIDGGASFRAATGGITGLGGGDDFRAVPDNFLFIAPLVMDPNDAQRLWLGGSRLWRTDDGAGVWGAASRRLSAKVSAIAVAEGRSQRVLAGTADGRIYRSDEALAAGPASQWSATRPRAGWVSWIAFDPSDARIAYATYAGFGGQHVWRSVDGGASWRAIDGAGATRVPNIPVHAIAVDPASPGRLYLGTDLGVLVSTDGGGSWAVESTGFARAVTESLAVARPPGGAPHLFAFTHGRGAWRVALE